MIHGLAKALKKANQAELKHVNASLDEVYAQRA